ncbi:MAG: biotin/lipoyl-binding protein [Anaerolineae bacterium]|nr:biotin/lipoyl-binding protein [Anaerolineae bacterium]
MPSYTVSALTAIFQIVLWFSILFILLPQLMFRTASGGWTRHLFDHVVRMSFVSIVIVHLLVLLNIYDIFSLVAAFIIVWLVYLAAVLKVPLLARSRSMVKTTIMSSLDVLDGRVPLGDTVKNALARLWRTFVGALPRGVDIWWAVAFIIVLMVSGYIRLSPTVTDPAPAYGDSYLHLLWLKGLGFNRLYPDGLYPFGGYALLQVLRQFTALDPTLLIQLIPGLAGVLLVAAIYWSVVRLTGSRGAGLIGSALYGIFAFARWLPVPVPPQGDVLTVELALIFLLPSIVYLAEAIAGREAVAQPANKTAEPEQLVKPSLPYPAASWLFLMAVTCVFLIQPFVGILALFGSIIAGVIAAVLGRSLWAGLRLSGLALVAAVLGMLPLLIGFAAGKPIHLGPMRWDVIFYGALLREGRFFPEPPPAPDLALLSYLGILGALLLILAPGRWLGVNRVLATGWRVFGVFLLVLVVLFKPALFSLPELLAPHQVGRVLGLTLCAVLGLWLHQVVVLLALLAYRLRLMSRERLQPLVARVGVPPAVLPPSSSAWELTATVVVLAALLLPFPSILIPEPTLAVSALPKREYEAVADQVYRIKEEIPTYRWTIVTYPEALPQILGKGFFVENEDFLENYDPEAWRFDPRQPELALSTPHVFIVVEKHPFVVSGDTTEEAKERDAIQQRLQDWVDRYQQTHNDMDIYYEDGLIAIYHIYRTPAEEQRILTAIEQGLLPTTIPPPIPVAPAEEATPAPGAVALAPTTAITYSVLRGDVVNVLEFDGQLVPVTQQAAFFRTGGRVSQVYVAPGDSVKAGQLLAELEAVELERELAAAQANVELTRANQETAAAQTTSDIRQAQLELEIARLNLAAGQTKISDLSPTETAPKLEEAFLAWQRAQADYDAIQKRLGTPAGQEETLKNTWQTDWVWDVTERGIELEKNTEFYLKDQLFVKQAQRDLARHEYEVAAQERQVELVRLRAASVEAGAGSAGPENVVKQAEANVGRLESDLAAAQGLDTSAMQPQQLAAHHEQIDNLEQQLAYAQLELKQAQANLAGARCWSVQDVKQAQLDLEEAQITLEAIKAQDPSLKFAEMEAQTNLERTKQSLDRSQARYNQAVEGRTPPPELAAWHQANMDLIQAKAAHEEATANNEYEQQLRTQQVKQAEQQLNRLQAGCDTTSDLEQQQAQFAVQQLEERLAKTQLVAPGDGYVFSLKLTPGQWVDPYLPVVIVADLSELEAAVDQFTASQLALLAENMPAQIISPFAAVERKAIPGYIRSLPEPAGLVGAPVEDYEIRDPAKSIWVALNESATTAGYQPGDLVKVVVIVDQAQGVLWLPPIAVRDEAGQKYVTVWEGDAEKRVPVQIGVQTQDRVEIKSGLTEGQVVQGQ